MGVRVRWPPRFPRRWGDRAEPPTRGCLCGNPVRTPCLSQTRPPGCPCVPGPPWSLRVFGGACSHVSTEWSPARWGARPLVMDVSPGAWGPWGLLHPHAAVPPKLGSSLPGAGTRAGPPAPRPLPVPCAAGRPAGATHSAPGPGGRVGGRGSCLRCSLQLRAGGAAPSQARNAGPALRPSKPSASLPQLQP